MKPLEVSRCLTSRVAGVDENAADCVLIYIQACLIFVHSGRSVIRAGNHNWAKTMNQGLWTMTQGTR